MKSDGNRVKTTQTSIDIVQHLSTVDGARVSEIAKELDLAPSTVHTHLSTLREERLVAKEGDLYHLGLEFLRLGNRAKYRKDSYERAEAYVRRLSEETGCRSTFLVEEHGLGVFLYNHTGEHEPWSHASAGQREYLHVLAAGKVILAHLPASELEVILETHGLPARTTNSITDPDALREDLATIRDRGFGVNDEENISGVRAVGVPAFDPDGRVIGGFSVSGAANRLTGEWFQDTLPTATRGIVNEFELELSLS